MQPTAQRHDFRLEELYERPDDGRRYELVRGWLVSEPPPGLRHGRVTACLVRLLHEFAHTRRLGVVCTGDSGFILARSPDTLRAPDVAFLSSERLQEVEDERLCVSGPPDLAVEVLSPSDRPNDLHAKVTDYLVAGTRLVWVVDPEAREVWSFRSPFSPRVLSAEDTLDGEDVLPGFTVEVSRLFEV